MTNRVQMRRSSVPSAVPLLAEMLVGEVALNIADKNVFYSTGTEVVQLNAASNIVTDTDHRFITDGQLAQLSAGYTLPVSTASTLGGVKIGSNIDVDVDGVISLKVASSTDTGVLSATDWAMFNAKQDDLGFIPVDSAGDTMTGYLTLVGAPTAGNHAATKTYVDTGLAAKLNLSGGTLTGDLILASDPTANLGAATKQYVDNATSLISGHIGAPVQAVVDLAAVTGATDKQLVLVEDNGSLYRYDAQSVLTPDGDGVVAAAEGGNWIKISSAVQNHEMLSGLQGGASGDHVHLTTAEKNGYDSHLADYEVHLTSTQNTWIDSINASAAEVNWLVGVTSNVQDQIDGKQDELGFTPVNKAGDTMLGMLALYADPVASMDAATKGWVENRIIDCGTF
jgi:hypothetical protein